MTMNQKVVIESGILSLSVSELNPLYKGVDELIQFASRINPKRGFLFVSKVLGKHIPVKPSEMRKTYNALAQSILSSGEVKDVFVVGMSETATGLGGGVAHELATHAGVNVIFQHTTRHLIDQPVWFNVSEDHSHAVEHIMYQSPKEITARAVLSERIVLVDDEISTGKTLLNLAKEMLVYFKNTKVIDIVALVSWFDEEKMGAFINGLKKHCDDLGMKTPDVKVHALMSGAFEFEKNPSFDFPLPTGTDKGAGESDVSLFGRVMVDMNKLSVKIPDGFMESLPKNNKVSIVGSAEYMFAPFLIAEQLENNGYDVVFQSSTRSPILLDGTVIKNRIKVDIQRGSELVNHFIYNFSKDRESVMITDSEFYAEAFSSIDSLYICKLGEVA